MKTRKNFLWLTIIFAGIWSCNGSDEAQRNSALDGSTNNQATVDELQKTWALSGGGFSGEKGQSIAVDGAGNTYVAGEFGNLSATFGDTTLDCENHHAIFLTKISPSGHFLWSTSIQGQNDGYSVGIAVDKHGNVFISGEFEGKTKFGDKILSPIGASDMFVAKVSPDGQFQWVAAAGGSDIVHGRSIAVDSDGDAYVIGKFNGSATFGAYSIASIDKSDDVFVAKINADGEFIWATSAGGEWDDWGNHITVGPNGTVFITGNFEKDAAFGTTHLSNPGIYNDIFIAALSPAGQFLWAKSAGGPRDDWAMGIAVDAKENVYVTGDFEGQATFGPTLISSDCFGMFVTKLSADGRFLWTISGNGGSASGKAIAVDTNGNAYVIGDLYDDITFGSINLKRKGESDVVVVKVTPNGQFQWATSAGGAKGATFTNAGDIVIDEHGHAFVTGDFRDPTTFGEVQLTPAQYHEWDAFIWKLDVP